MDDQPIDKKFDDDPLETEEKCRKLFDHMNEGFAYCKILFDEDVPKDFVYLNVNKAFETLTGLQNVVGKRVSETIPGFLETDKKLFEIYSRVATLMKAEKFEIFVEALKMWFSVSVYSPGKGYFVAVFDVINERKNAEKALLEAERLNAVAEMTTGVAHDFNNSLQVILGNLDIALLYPNIPNEISEPLESAKRSASDAASRVRQLQRFANKKSVDFTALDINILIDGVIFLTRPIWKDEAERKGLKFSFQKNYGQVKSIDGNVGELESAFHNLLKNAVEAMPNGGTITIETDISDDNVHVRITDTGIGMNEETKKRIFQHFYTTKGFDTGRGLGMSSVFSTIRDHFGKISIKYTEIGKGTTIELLFPIGTNKAEITKEEDFEHHKISTHILWVDDDIQIRKLFKNLLEQLGHFISVASSGNEALKLLGKNHYDLLVTDIGMPNMSGWQLIEEVKGKHTDMKVAIVSGWEINISDEDKKKYGVDYIIEKPIKIDDLKKLLQEVFQSKL